MITRDCLELPSPELQHNLLLSLEFNILDLQNGLGIVETILSASHLVNIQRRV